MKYDLVKIDFGASNAAKQTTIEIEGTAIKSFCCMGDDDYLFATENHIGMVRGGKVEFPWFTPTFQNIQSIAYNKIYGGCYVMARQGADCFFLEMPDPYMREASDIVSKGYHYLLKSFNKLGNAGVVSSVLLDSGLLYFVNSTLNRGFVIKEASHHNWIGTGRPEYAVSNKLESCALANPLDLCAVNNTLYITDCGNSCIRSCHEDGISLFLGNPTIPYSEDGSFDNATFEYPKAFKVKNGMCYILDGDTLKYAMTANRTVGTICQIQGSELLEINSKRGAVVLVRSE